MPNADDPLPPAGYGRPKSRVLTLDRHLLTADSRSPIASRRLPSRHLVNFQEHFARQSADA